MGRRIALPCLGLLDPTGGANYFQSDLARYRNHD